MSASGFLAFSISDGPAMSAAPELTISDGPAMSAAPELTHDCIRHVLEQLTLVDLVRAGGISRSWHQQLHAALQRLAQRFARIVSYVSLVRIKRCGDPGGEMP